jgi:hypothetical protein
MPNPAVPWSLRFEDAYSPDGVPGKVMVFELPAVLVKLGMNTDNLELCAKSFADAAAHNRVRPHVAPGSMPNGQGA